MRPSELAAELSGGSSGAKELDVEAAFAAHAEALRRFLVRMGTAAPEADDLTAETFLIAHRRRATFDVSRPVRPWLYGIAAQLARKHRRRAWVARLLSLRFGRSEVEPEPAADPEQRAIEAEDGARVREALARMPERKRMLLVLREYEGLSTEEIASALQVPEGTVHSALHHARRELLRQYRRLALLEAVR